MVLGGRVRISLHLEAHLSATLFYLQNSCAQGSKKPLAVIQVFKKISASAIELIPVSLENWPSSGYLTARVVEKILPKQTVHNLGWPKSFLQQIF